jgi:sporulation protein YlmC with PRC-barrel domain
MELTRLSSDNRWHVRQGEPELLGYTVLDSYDEFLGEVVDLVIDTTFQKVPFVVVMAATGQHAHQRVILPMRDVTMRAEARQIIVEGAANALDLHPVDDGRDLSQLLDVKLAATFFTDVDRRPSLPTGLGETVVEPDAAILEVRHPGEYCEKVDEVFLRDAQGAWVEKPDAEGQDTCQGGEQAP